MHALQNVKLLLQIVFDLCKKDVKAKQSVKMLLHIVLVHLLNELWPLKTVLFPYLSVAPYHPFIGGQFFQLHGPAGMQFPGADANCSPITKRRKPPLKMYRSRDACTLPFTRRLPAQV